VHDGADVVADGIPGHFSENFVVLADGPIKKIEDVKGKRVATRVNALAADHRREEIARMLAGAEITAEARAAAERLLKAATA